MHLFEHFVRIHRNDSMADGGPRRFTNRKRRVLWCGYRFHLFLEWWWCVEMFDPTRYTRCVHLIQFHDHHRFRIERCRDSRQTIPSVVALLTFTVSGSVHDNQRKLSRAEAGLHTKWRRVPKVRIGRRHHLRRRLLLLCYTTSETA